MRRRLAADADHRLQLDAVEQVDPGERVGVEQRGQVDEPNRIVTVACWPLRVLLEDASPESRRVVGRLLFVIAKEPHGLRRLDGLAAILARVMPVAALRERALIPFVQAAAASKGWRTERLVGWMAARLATYDRSAAVRLLDGRGANRFTNKARAVVESLDADARPR